MKNVRYRRAAGVVVLASLSLGFTSGCGSDQAAGSSEDVFCAAGDSLRTNIETIGDIDLIDGGTDAISERFSAIESDLQQLQDSGSDLATNEISALDSAIDDLGSALEALGRDISVTNARQIATSVADVVSTAGDVLERLSTTCS
ncbi:MAG: hypothetical protein ACJAR2_000814 [Ilumatobacter sp.]|jgi:hypothetical protein